jgi:DNA mismatch endonuclease, patch repair protein
LIVEATTDKTGIRTRQSILEPVASLETSWASSAGTRRSMQANKGRDTRPELAVRSAVHALGLRYRVSTRPIPTLRRTADLVFTRAKVAVFVDGCFWHGCAEHHSVAKTNAGYWADKVRNNKRRDVETDAALTVAGWLAVRAWEHEPPTAVAERIQAAVLQRMSDAEHSLCRSAARRAR